MKCTRYLLAVMLFFAWASTASAIEVVEASWLKDNLNNKNLRIIEVPEKAEVISGEHKKGVMHLPNTQVINRYLDLGNIYAVPPTQYPTKDQFEKLMSNIGVDKDTTVVAYDDKYGIFASRLLVIMEHYGHDTDKLKLLNGGKVHWAKLGYPMEDKHADVAPTRYNVTKMNPVVISWSDVYRDAVVSPSPGLVLVDVRPADEYSGKKIRSIRGGHIPNAINITGTDANNKEDHTFKSKEELKQMFVSQGVTPEKTIYTYCHSGDRTAHAYIILKSILGYNDVKIYATSWTEWATILSLPAEAEVWYTEKEKP
jgi:thiosulfate/3-mercaptopyruvate sulfurtransferase